MIWQQTSGSRKETCCQIIFAIIIIFCYSKYSVWFYSTVILIISQIIYKSIYFRDILSIPERVFYE